MMYVFFSNFHFPFQHFFSPIMVYVAHRQVQLITEQNVLYEFILSFSCWWWLQTCLSLLLMLQLCDMEHGHAHWKLCWMSPSSSPKMLYSARPVSCTPSSIRCETILLLTGGPNSNSPPLQGIWRVCIMVVLLWTSVKQERDSFSSLLIGESIFASGMCPLSSPESLGFENIQCLLH